MTFFPFLLFSSFCYLSDCSFREKLNKYKYKKNKSLILFSSRQWQEVCSPICISRAQLGSIVPATYMYLGTNFNTLSSILLPFFSINVSVKIINSCSQASPQAKQNSVFLQLSGCPRLPTGKMPFKLKTSSHLYSVHCTN